MAIVGGPRDVNLNQNSAEIEEYARFAVDEHNKKEVAAVPKSFISNALLEFVRLLKAKEQVVAGTLHHLTLEAIDAGKKKIYEAKVWVKPWLNHKELQEFKHAGDGGSASFTTADLGAKRGGHEPGWRPIPTHDPIVQEAANHALKAIQAKSNSLAAYELLEIQNAKAEVIDDFAKLELLLKLKRGPNEEKYKVEVHKNLEGAFILNQMQQEQ
ncbi:Cysteine proteinase inhibitor 12 [Dendrobium catenatum]|uniref:Cysteine proteinase inhibitor n=1 Tax=Dendrobium catenatum TaxID=906689 RepID=A0A2I0WEY8_9ASPA|nr:Cysteine proteinase inhibitor 12 [Dendrobium catenatum]